MASIYIETAGCQMNEADSRYLAENAVAAGYTLVDRAEAANVLVLNTCTVRDSAEKRAYGRIGFFKTLKQRDPALKIAVCGCLAEQDRDTMRARVPHVDALYGTKELPQLSATIAAWAPEFGAEDVLDQRALLASLPAADVVHDAFAPLRAYINVQFGCSYYCSYCIVPAVRGRFEHRPLTEILAEVAERTANGAHEITLVGQTVNAYADPASGLNFAGLLRAVSAVPGVQRVGFVTSHPKDLDDELIATFAGLPQLNARFHLALQSGSDPILRRMNRKYTIDEYLERVEAFRKACPDWALTTDIIVAFPGETESDFQRTLEIVERGLFAQVYAFIYSPRRGTPAAKMEQLSADVGTDRIKRLMTVVNRNVTAYHEKKIGSTVRVLATGPSRKDSHRLAAKSGDNVTILTQIDGDAARFAATPWLEVEIESAHVWGCSGKLVGVSETCTQVASPVQAPLFSLL